MQQHARQCIPVALAATQNSDRLKDLVFRKQETPQQVAQLGLRGPRRYAGDVVEDPSGWVELLVLVLGKIIGLGVVPQAVFAVARLLRSGQNLDQRGFSRAVDSHQRDAVPALDGEVHIAEDLLRAVALGDSHKLCDHAPARLGLRKAEVDSLLIGRYLDALDLLQLLDAALHLLCLGRLRAEAVNASLQLLDLVALVFVGRLELRAPRLFLRQVLVVISGIEVDALVPYLRRLRNRDVEEVAAM